ncbi:MAG: PAS domain S-box protein, partial [Candidatus Limnocylindrales bacterium]
MEPPFVVLPVLAHIIHQADALAVHSCEAPIPMPDTLQPSRTIVPVTAPVADPSVDQLRAVAEAMLDPLVVLVAIRDEGGTIVDFSVTFANSAFASMNGADRATIDGQRMEHLLPAYRENGLFAAFAAVTETGEPYVDDAFSFDGADADGLPLRYAIDLRVVRVGDGVAVTGRDITTYVATHEATVTSEERFRLLAERSRDVIFKYRTSPAHEFEYVSPSIEALSGYTAADLYADPTLAFRMIHPDDRPEFDRQTADGRLFTTPILVRWVRKDGRIVWTEQTNTEILDGTGQRVAVEGVARDATIRVEAAAAVTASESRFRSALEGIGLHAAIMDRTGHILFVNSYLARRTGWSREELVGRDAFEVFLTDGAREAQRSGYLRAIELEQVSGHWETEWLAKDGAAVRIAWTSSLVRDESGAVVGISSVGEDVTERRQHEERQARLSAAVEQTAEAIIVTSADGRIVYANPAFESASGVRTEEAFGRRPWNVMQIGHGADFRSLIRQLRAGQAWAGEWEIYRADGGMRREEVSVAPMRDVDGAITGYVAVAHDVTQIRELQRTLDAAILRRIDVSRAMSVMETQSTAEQTAQEITDAVVELPGVDVAMLIAFSTDGDAIVLAVTAGDGYPVTPGTYMPQVRADYLRERAVAGPWVEPWVARPEDGEYGAAVTLAGLQAVAYAPLANSQGLFGLLSIGTSSPDDARHFADQLSMTIEFAATARSLLSAQMTERREIRSVRSKISTVLAAGTYRAVFQPIVDMSTGAAIGYEALTRFDDGTPPDQ